MCVIVCKEKNMELPTKKVLQECFNTNQDGVGFSYVRDNKVIIEKGFFKFEKFYDRLMEVDRELDLYNKSLVIHFRWTTHGSTTSGNCHPFPITNNIDDIKATYFESDFSMVHNGIISNYGKNLLEDISDTQNFVIKYVFEMMKKDNRFLSKENNLNLLLKECENTKLAFLDVNDNITKVGNFTELNGIWFSNLNWQDVWEDYKYIPTYYYDDSYYSEEYYSEDMDIFFEEYTLTEFSEILDNINIIDDNALIIYEDYSTEEKTIEELEINKDTDGGYYAIHNDYLCMIDYFSLKFVCMGKVLDYFIDITSTIN